MSSLESILDQQGIDTALAEVISIIAATTIAIADKLRCGGLGEALGSSRSENVQGEIQKNLDIIANSLMLDALGAHPLIRALASEEEAHPIVATRGAPYLVAFDPLDGSSNVDINAPVGTIFTIFHARDDVQDQNDAQFFQSGKDQLCAGYALYGPYTTLLLTTGRGVLEFTLDLKNRKFILSRPEILIPHGTREFSANMANLFYWSQSFQYYIASLIEKNSESMPFNMRWQGAMVSDVHKVLTRGGFFAYPSDCRASNKHGKLRLLYEALPMAMLVENAGGCAYSESDRILDMTPISLHQRTPVFLGDEKLVTECFHSFTTKNIFHGTTGTSIKTV
jgi:fructose-1,6-bisphosphatase I